MREVSHLNICSQIREQSINFDGHLTD
jgi:hypothetical protein